ncbi:MAG: YiiD C-terminal domain-containing protein [Bdellovibrionales bacterium]|nr:YiiD C-terminal domain-containing protein [Bdellovibrionales bacterium]
MERAGLEQLLREQMPLALAMDVRVALADANSIELTCRLAPNHNHLGSAFGGSLSALMILAAYCRLFHLMNGQGHVLLKSSQMEFFKPVHEDLRAICGPPDPREAQEFLKTYNKKGRARLTLVSEIRLTDGTVAARMTGEFVGREEASGK